MSTRKLKHEEIIMIIKIIVFIHLVNVSIVYSSWQKNINNIYNGNCNDNGDDNSDGALTQPQHDTRLYVMDGPAVLPKLTDA